ncbi:MAG: (Fe-S)-binding protein [Magnetococcales bacterium]|nr:(Fe-S)-binding protein [Magnetococcales bacterium]
MPQPSERRLSSLLDNADQCTHCGYCLPVCPTYRVNNDEVQSPRGRVSIVLAVQQGRVSPAAARPLLDHCLLCRACHPACPAGVRPAKLVIASRRLAPPVRRPWSATLLHRCTDSHGATRLLAGLLDRYRRWGVGRGLRRWGLLRLLPPLDRLERLIPLEVAPTPALLPPPAAGPRVALLCGCMGRTFYPAIGPSAANLLSALGCQVVVPEGFGCCGAPLRESGDHGRFLDHARRVLDRFAAAGAVEAVVCDSSVCAVTARSYGKALAKDAAYRDRAKEFSRKVSELSRFLTSRDAAGRLALGDPGLGRLTCQDHCQSRHGLGIVSEPRELLAATGALTVDLPRSDRCCGAGGDYMLRHAPTSRLVREDKLDAIAACGAKTVVAGNPGCMVNIAAGLEQRGLPVRVRHLAEVLWAAAGATQDDHPNSNRP